MRERELAKVLRAERKRRNKSQYWLALKTGLGENTISHFENGHNVTFRTAVKIADALGYVIKWELVKKVDK